MFAVNIAVVELDARDAVVLSRQPPHRRPCAKFAAQRLERFDVGLRRLHGIGVAAVRLVDDAGDAVGIDLGQVLREARALGPFIHDAETTLHRDVLRPPSSISCESDEAVAGLHKARVAAELSLCILEHRDAGAGKPHQQRRGVALPDDRGALAGAAARRLAALDQQRFRATLAQVIGGRGAADAGADNDRVVAHSFGSTP